MVEFKYRSLICVCSRFKRGHLSSIIRVKYEKLFNFVSDIKLFSNLALILIPHNIKISKFDRRATKHGQFTPPALIFNQLITVKFVEHLFVQDENVQKRHFFYGEK
uniref:Uncharacterized protein n=1 Tax=Romanomermis culicivorax TaxID=13658 RepID=A0A915I7P4_ROMCU